MFEGQILPKVPITFKNSTEYTQIWNILSNYELLSQLKTGKRTIKDESTNLAGIEMHNDFSSKQTMWVGYCVQGKRLNFLQALKMYDEPPHSKNIAAPNTVELQQLQVDREINRDFNMGQIKEYDLVLLTQEKLRVRDKHDL